MAMVMTFPVHPPHRLLVPYALDCLHWDCVMYLFLPLVVVVVVVLDECTLRMLPSLLLKA